MKAIYYRQYGSSEQLNYGEFGEIPSPGRNSIVIQCAAGGLNPKDILLRKGHFAPLLDRQPLPRISGLDVSGEVIAIGDDVSHFAVGDRVFSMSGKFHGGMHAEYAELSEFEAAKIPADLSFIDAAAVPLAALTALQAIRDICKAQPGQSILINGASGGVGHFAVQIAAIYGLQVDAVCGPKNIEWVTRLGADHVHDYQKVPANKIAKRFDFIFDVFGKYNFSDFKDQLKPASIYVNTIPKRQTILAHLLHLLKLNRRNRLVIVKSRRKDLELLAEWLADGKLIPYVQQVYPANKAAEAHRHIETRHTKGKVVIDLKSV